MAAIVNHTQDHRGMWSSTCPDCGTLFVYWEDDDLDEDGNLWCYCEPEPEPDYGTFDDD